MPDRTSTAGARFPFPDRQPRVDTSPVYYQDETDAETGVVRRHLFNRDRCYLGTYGPSAFAGSLLPYDLEQWETWD